MSESISARSVWHDFKRVKLGILGAALLIFFICLAIFSPLITPYDPIEDTFLAESHAYPAWFRLNPQYQDLPPNLDIIIPSTLNDEGWSSSQQNSTQLNDQTIQFTLIAKPKTQTVVQVKHSFTYEYSPPETLIIEGGIQVPKLHQGSLNVTMGLETPEGRHYKIWSETLESSTPLIEISYSSKAVSSYEKEALGLDWFENLAAHLMATKGTYHLVFIATFSSVTEGVAVVELNTFSIHIPGRAFGLLGTDHIGADLFSQLVYGARISLFIGILASFIATVLGLLVGVTAGYSGAKVDEGLMRVVDLLLVLPFLPLLMVVSGLFGKSLWNLVFLLGILSWPGFARVIRAKTLQLKSVTFVEASKAIGGSKSHIIGKHIIPNVLPYIYAVIALSIPGFIITEAALSFLALGDPSQPSWGRMFYTAKAFGAFSSLSWWWIIPPGILITLLSLSFVFIGHALDEVINPRLRVKR